jgi:hypothetical protein
LIQVSANDEHHRPTVELSNQDRHPDNFSNTDARVFASPGSDGAYHDHHELIF